MASNQTPAPTANGGEMPGRGLEPLRIAPPDPKSGASANFATPAYLIIKNLRRKGNPELAPAPLLTSQNRPAMPWQSRGGLPRARERREEFGHEPDSPNRLPNQSQANPRHSDARRKARLSTARTIKKERFVLDRRKTLLGNAGTTTAPYLFPSPETRCVAAFIDGFPRRVWMAAGDGNAAGRAQGRGFRAASPNYWVREAPARLPQCRPDRPERRPA
jgi:hypothetical protein